MQIPRLGANILKNTTRLVIMEPKQNFCRMEEIKYNLRLAPRADKTPVSTWVDVDNSGNYVPHPNEELSHETRQLSHTQRY